MFITGFFKISIYSPIIDFFNYLLNKKMKIMKKQIIMAVTALFISAAITAQQATQAGTQTREKAQSGTQTQTRAGAQTQTQTQAGIRTQTQTRIQDQSQTATKAQSGTMAQTQTRIQDQSQYKNQGQMTMAQKQARNEERKALKKQQKEMKNQEAVKEGNVYREQEKTATQNRGARTATPQRQAAKVSRSTGAGRK